MASTLEYICGFPKSMGNLLWGPYSEDYAYLGAIFGFTCLGELPNIGLCKENVRAQLLEPRSGYVL